MRCQLGCQVNRGRAVSTADDANGCRFLHIEAEHHSACQRNEYADLGSCAEKHGLRVGQQRTEVGHRAYPHENKGRENFILDPKSDGHHDAHFIFKPGIREVGHDAAERDWEQQQRFIFLRN